MAITASTPGGSTTPTRSPADTPHFVNTEASLFNRMLGQLYHCLQTGQTFDETKAFHQPTDTPGSPVTA
jgi:hypothetical protein